MWNKDETESTKTTPTRQPEVKPAGGGTSPRTGGLGDRAVIGRSITIKGDISGDEDLYIQGSVDGSVKLKEHNVTISAEGRIKANVHGRTITVQGHVEGDLFGEEQVVLSPSCRVRGNITAPRVALEDGANFRGTIDMESKGSSTSSAIQQSSSDQSVDDKTPAVKTGDFQNAAKSGNKKP